MSIMSSFERIIYEVEKGRARITLNRPEKLKSVPPELLEPEVEQLADRLAKIDPDLLSSNKRIINTGLELMGARTLQRLAAEGDARAHRAEATEVFRRTHREKGLKAALTERDGKFGDGRARVKGPEIRDENGRLVNPENG